MKRRLLDKAGNRSRDYATRHAKACDLLTEALDRMLIGQPPIYGRTWTTCLKIKRFLKSKPE